MTDKETFVNMLREVVKRIYVRQGYSSGYSKEFEEMYFLENKDSVCVYGADDDCINFYFDKNGKINFFD